MKVEIWSATRGTREVEIEVGDEVRIAHPESVHPNYVWVWVTVTAVRPDTDQWDYRLGGQEYWEYPGAVTHVRKDGRQVR